MEIFVTDPEKYPGHVLKLTLLDDAADGKAKNSQIENEKSLSGKITVRIS